MFAFTVTHEAQSRDDRIKVQAFLVYFDAHSFYDDACIHTGELSVLRLRVPDRLYSELTTCLGACIRNSKDDGYGIYGYSVHLFYHEDGEKA